VRALITGVTGQDGSYLAELLTSRGWEVFGVVRGQRNPRYRWITQLVPTMTVVEADLLDQSSLQMALTTAEPDVVFNLGALTYVGASWAQPTLMSEVTGLGVLRLLEAIRLVNSKIKLVHASSSEMFGDVREIPQTETTPLNPRSPYGVAKSFAHHTVVNYRDSYGIHASGAIMFNHESPRRGREFVTRKVTSAVARIAKGLQDHLYLGNLDAQRDWGWAPDYVRALELISRHDVADDWVVATGEMHSVRELCQRAFAIVGLDWERHVRQDPALYRPADVEQLRGDARKIADQLGWRPTHYFDDIVKQMVHADTEALP
jgi:GDPmannose 4,6-dehydratase